MFQKQVRFVAKEEKAMKKLCMFGTIVYIKAWFTPPNATQALRRDLVLLGLFFFSPTKQSSMLPKTKCRNICGMSEELVIFSFFDYGDRVPLKTNEHMTR